MGVAPSSTQGTVLDLFTLYIQYKYSADAAVVGCMPSGQEVEYRDPVEAFGDWSFKNSLLLNRTNTKQMVLDFMGGDIWFRTQTPI